MAGPKLPGELTWPKLLGTSLAAVTAAWVAGYFGLGNTLSGAAIGSAVATIAAAFFTTTISKSHTILVRTDHGTVIESPAVADVVDEDTGTSLMPAVSEAPATANESRWRRIHWKSVAIAAVLTLAVALLGITLYEEAVGRTWGSNEPGTSIGNTVRGGPQTPASAPTPTPSPTETPTPEPTPTPTETPTPTSTPSPTPTPTECATPTAPTGPTPSPAPTDSASPCPTPTATASATPTTGTNPLLR
jgi:outer membrane biosynthesis protein TonB